MSTPLRLCSVAPNSRMRCGVPLRRDAGTGMLSSPRRYFAVSDRGSLIRPCERARVDHAAAVLAGAEAHVDDVIRHRDHVGVVLDDDHGVALIAQLPEDRDQPLVVARVQADRRLVEHVQRADQRRAERRREVDALRLAARQRRRQPIERQVVEADVAQEARGAAGSPSAPCRRSPLPSRSAAGRRRTSPLRARCAPTPCRWSRRRPARRALRAAAACRCNRGTSGSRDSGSGTRGRGPCISCARASGRSRARPRSPSPSPSITNAISSGVRSRHGTSRRTPLVLAARFNSARCER